MNYYTSLFKGIIEKRKLIWDLAKADFKKRFVGSYFGVVWMLSLIHISEPTRPP